jgi:hypothetical protein
MQYAETQRFFMQNPFEVIIERLDGIDSKLNVTSNPPATSQTEIIDRSTLCKRLNITEPTAIRWEKRGAIPFLRIGSNVRYSWFKVIEALEGKKEGRHA